ncbi:uncharacterized protein LOC123316856 [Coccinella septempunctata]|uniref:uncharacterized protein LOC123316856 n=1 Tax=Coccinella septempunctata TaxID=41139 RepID=UPI001D08FE62|nr:uncharacterized protein LOC123316856 [Coccinella septempunctata]
MDDNLRTINQARGFFQTIRDQMGTHVCNTCKLFLTSRVKLASLYNRRIFLLGCRSNRVFPNHIINNIKQILSLQIDEHPYRSNVDLIMKTFRKSVLNVEIKITAWKIRQFEGRIQRLRDQLTTTIDNSTYETLVDIANTRFRREFSNIKSKNVNKLKTLKNQQIPPLPITTCDKYIANYTNITISNEVKTILGLGPKFGLPPKHIPMETIIKDIESFIKVQPITEEEKNTYRSKSVNIVSNYKKRERHTRRNNTMDKYLKDTTKFIREHQDITISRADKGGATVLMYKEEYQSGVEKMLSDENTYERLQSDPTPKIQRHTNKYIKTLKDENYITETEYKHLIRHNSIAPKLYCLRKVHKNTLSLRPIVSCIKSPTYKT